MRIFNKDLIEKFISEHGDSQTELSRWVCNIENIKRKRSSTLASTFSGMARCGNSRYRVSLCGGMYRIVVLIFFSSDMVAIRFVGTAEEFAKIDCSTI